MARVMTMLAEQIISRRVAYMCCALCGSWLHALRHRANPSSTMPQKKPHAIAPKTPYTSALRLASRAQKPIESTNQERMMILIAVFMELSPIYRRAFPADNYTIARIRDRFNCFFVFTRNSCIANRDIRFSVTRFIISSYTPG